MTVNGNEVVTLNQLKRVISGASSLYCGDKITLSRKENYTFYGWPQ